MLSRRTQVWAALWALSLFLTMASTVGAVGINLGDDSIENEYLRSDLYPVLGTLADGGTVRQVFEQALSGDPLSAHALLSLVNHPSVQVVGWSARVLGRFGGPQVSEKLNLLATDTRTPVRAGALRGLFRMQDPAASPIARSWLMDPDHSIQIAALATLEGLGDSTNCPAIIALLDSPTRVVTRTSVFETLAALGDAPGSTMVLDRLTAEAHNKSNSMLDRSAAALALEKLGHPGLAGAVLDRLNVKTTFVTLLVARAKVRKLLQHQGVTLRSQGQLDSLLSAIDVDGKRPIRDSWGQVIRGAYLSPGVFNVVSDGPDKTPNTGDDVSTAETFASYDARVFASLFGPPVQ